MRRLIPLATTLSGVLLAACSTPVPASRASSQPALLSASYQKTSTSQPTPTPSTFAPYRRPITGIIVKKSQRLLYLLDGHTVVRKIHVDLGPHPKGDKHVEGDGRTPEGLYRIDRKNPHSLFHLSLGISYPNAQDRAQAAALGQNPGGDIMIHGDGPEASYAGTDWTAGCIAMTDAEMNHVFASVRVGTPILILP